MLKRVMLGWDRPLLDRVVDWLWERRESLPEWTVVVPTAQAGRRLRETLAVRGACLAPRVVTPGWLLDGPGEDEVPAAAEVLAWVEVLERISAWERYASVFPQPPGEDESLGWALPLATSLARLERSLQEAAVTLEEAARRLQPTLEGPRWTELAELWRAKEGCLREWGWRGRSVSLARRVGEPLAGPIVLAGVPDLPQAAVERLAQAEGVVLIGAPEGEAFDDYGRPEVEAWSQRRIAWPAQGEVTLSADPRQQALHGVERVAAAGTAAEDLALGSADDETAAELVRVFRRAGWCVHHPGGRAGSPMRGWLVLWRGWLQRPEVATAIDLLGLADTGRLVGGMRMQRVRQLSEMRDRGLVRSAEDVRRWEAAMEARSAQPMLAAETMDKLEAVRGAFLRQPFAEAMERLLDRIDPGGAWVEVRDWLTLMAPALQRVDRDAVFWLELLVDALSEPPPEPPEGRVADVQGWLELLHEPGSHLVICGLNEGAVPATPGADAWLSDGVRRLLGLACEARRVARDAYVLTALLKAREADGRVDLLLAKASGSGDALQPSRLLLRAEGQELAERVGTLFAELEPPDAGLAWQRDWAWRVPAVELKARLGVTALSDYLACPLRFYLKHGARMQRRDPERTEWDARDFGNVMHAVLERWGRDEEAREMSKAEALAAWLEAELQRVVAERHGSDPPLTVRIQTAGARQRLSWFARLQACERAAGWRIAEVETKFVQEIDGFELVGKVDRIDQHDDGRRRILDYKTHAKMKEAEGAHRVRIHRSTRWPAHLAEVEAVICETAAGKAKRWINLQVPLYAAALGATDAEVGYFVVGSTEADVGLSLWPGFGEADCESALACARWIIGRVGKGVFWPPAERVTYDDFDCLAAGRPLGEMVEEVSS